MLRLKTVEHGFEGAGNKPSVNVVMHDRPLNLLSKSSAYVVKKVMDRDLVSGVGAVVCRELEADEVLKVDVECLLAMDMQVVYDFQVLGTSNEADVSCIATMSGPGLVWLQSTSYKD